MARLPLTREGHPDARYTITTEQEYPLVGGGLTRHVVRFNAEYVGRHSELDVAEAIAQYHADTDGGGSPLIESSHPVRPLPPEQVIAPTAGMIVMTCGVCHRSWDDAVSTTMTPVPSGRCPFEYEHITPYEDDADPDDEDPYDVNGAPRYSFTENANVPMMTLGQFRAATAYRDASTLIVVETGTNQERHVASMGMPSGDPESDASGFNAVTLFMGTPLDYRDF
jgi:hypothetical protein